MDRDSAQIESKYFDDGAAAVEQEKKMQWLNLPWTPTWASAPADKARMTT
jgi:hypothetical protein